MSTVLSTSKTSKPSEPFPLSIFSTPQAGALGPWWGMYKDGCTLLIKLRVNKILIFIRN